MNGAFFLLPGTDISSDEVKLEVFQAFIFTDPLFPFFRISLPIFPDRTKTLCRHGYDVINLFIVNTSTCSPGFNR